MLTNYQNSVSGQGELSCQTVSLPQEAKEDQEAEGLQLGGRPQDPGGVQRRGQRQGRN